MNKTKNAAPVLVALDRRSRVPKLRQIYGAIRDAILSGRILSGARLPATRDLAGDLGVSRTIVVLAYERLATEGYLVGRGSAGSFVAALGGAGPPASRARATRPRLADPGIAITLPVRSDGLQHIRPAPLPFRIGEPAIDLFPVRLWSQIHARLARRSGASLLAYGAPGGYRPLREAIAGYVGAARGVNATADQVILTRGAQQAIDLIGRVLIRRGDEAWVEDPGYLAARALLELAGATLVPVRVDEQGLDVAAGERASPLARLAYVSPSHHFPLGATMALPRRLALLDWARRAGAWIVEDDFDSEFRYAGTLIPSLQGLDAAQRVIYLGTFSKTVFPSLRLGYLIVPPDLAGIVQRTQTLVDHIAPGLEQATLAAFIDAGHYTRHVRRMRAEYSTRQAALLDGIARELPDLLEATAADTGMHVVGWLTDDELDDRVVSRLAWDAGVEVAPLSAYAIRATSGPGLLMGFAAVAPAQVRPALRVLRTAILKARRRPPQRLTIDD
jgi:GntR family transcriptional regulator/MocR family aminotransferase